MKSLLALVGISQALGPTLTEDIGEDVDVLLVREPANPYDNNAIKVYIPIGYIKKEQAAKLAPKLDVDADTTEDRFGPPTWDGKIIRNHGTYAEIEIEEPA